MRFLISLIGFVAGWMVGEYVATPIIDSHRAWKNSIEVRLHKLENR